jgi:hypothetical protein
VSWPATTAPLPSMPAAHTWSAPTWEMFHSIARLWVPSMPTAPRESMGTVGLAAMRLTSSRSASVRTSFRSPRTQIMLVIQKARWATPAFSSAVSTGP